MIYCAPLRGHDIDRHLKYGSPGNDVWLESRNDRDAESGDPPLDHFWDDQVLAFDDENQQLWYEGLPKTIKE